MAKSKLETNNTYVLLTILLSFFTLAIGTRIHDPILHSIVAILNGWSITEWESGLMIGSTTAMISAATATNTSTTMFWLYFMFPPIFIYVVSFLINVFFPNRLIRVSGFILMALNLASVNPEIKGSDAYNAAVFLTTRGWSETTAFGIQYLIMFGFIVLYGLYLYISVEDNDKDARNRMKNLWS